MEWTTPGNAFLRCSNNLSCMQAMTPSGLRVSLSPLIAMAVLPENQDGQKADGPRKNAVLLLLLFLFSFWDPSFSRLHSF